jgi:predicted translin family RNA/ssDNA-binding protein
MIMTPAFAKKTADHARELDRSRRALQALSSEILSGSKRAIFAFHRDNEKAAAAELSIVSAKLKEGWKLVKNETRIAQEGMWRAAQEEFAEADLLSQYILTGKIGPVAGVAEDPDVFVGAVSDLTGELVRRAVLLASDGKIKPIHQIFDDVREVVGFLLSMDLTGSLRTKVDQAKSNLRKLEEIRYDLSLRGHRPGV